MGRLLSYKRKYILLPNVTAMSRLYVSYKTNCWNLFWFSWIKPKKKDIHIKCECPFCKEKQENKKEG